MSESVEFGTEEPKKPRSSRKKKNETPDLHIAEPSLEEQVATADEIEVAESMKDTKRTLAAVNMRLAGFSYETIASQLEFNTPRMARQTVIAAIAGSASIEDSKTLREIESARLDRLLASVWTRATNPNNPEQLQYNRRASEIIEQHTRLHGLNAPSVLAVINPDAEKFSQVLDELKRATEGDVDPEGDIFELEANADGTFEEAEELGDEGGA